MSSGFPRLRIAASLFLLLVTAGFAPRLFSADQSRLEPLINSGQKTLAFDWPMVRIGTAEYAEGPTGVTVFHFGRKVHAAVDVRGGGPGTVNTDYLRLGYDWPELDSVVFAGGSWYGLEATTAVATALKDDGLRDGRYEDIALSIGAIIYDLGDRRLNEIYPDKRLAQAAFRAARPGVFPIGPHGAGRLAKTGWYFGCNAHSGQGAAFRQVGDVKIAAFTVVNAVGVVANRDGTIAACYPDAAWPESLQATDLMAGLPDSKKSGWTGPTMQSESKRNTTVSLVITNQEMNPAEIQRFAVQVHTSMSRGIQPFATDFDGDVLYAVSTAELPRKGAQATATDIGIVASEVMWDAILSSVPEQPVARSPDASIKLAAADLRKFSGRYVFSEFAEIEVSVNEGKLMARATGKRDAYSIRRQAAVELLPVAVDEFTVPGRYPLTIRFDAQRVILNPGHWQQIGVRRK